MMNPLTTPLLTDLYQLNMLQAYLECGQTETAVFEFFIRKLPRRRYFLMAAGLEQALGFLENFRFSDEELGWLAATKRFDKSLLGSIPVFSKIIAFHKTCSSVRKRKRPCKKSRFGER